LVPCNFEQKGIAYHLLARLQNREDLLAVTPEHLAGVNLSALELIATRRQEDPVVIMQVKQGIGRSHGTHLLATPGEDCSPEHAQLGETGIGNLNAYLGGAKRRIGDGTYVADAIG
jgi:hypothetical protein